MAAVILHKARFCKKIFLRKIILQGGWVFSVAPEDHCSRAETLYGCRNSGRANGLAARGCL